MPSTPLGIIASHYTPGSAPPLGVTLLTSAGSDTDASTYNTASVSPAANSLLVAVCHGSHGTLLVPTAAPTGLSLTWTSRINLPYSGTTTVRRLQVHTAQCGASPGSGAITFTYTGNTPSTGCIWSILQVVGHDTASPWVQSNTTAPGNVATVSVTLSAAVEAATNLLLAFFTQRSTAAMTPRTNWTELSEATTTTPGGNLETQWRLALETTGSVSWTGSQQAAGAICEIREAA